MTDDPGNREFPISFREFAASLVGTADEVWTHLLRRAHRAEKHLVADWRAVLDSYRDRPAHRR